MTKIIKYEKLVKSPEIALRKTLGYLGLNAPDEIVSTIANAYSSSNVSGTGKEGNRFLGDYTPPSNKTIEIIKHELQDTAKHFGY